MLEHSALQVFHVTTVGFFARQNNNCKKSNASLFNLMGEVIHALYLFAALQGSSNPIFIHWSQIKVLPNYISSTFLKAKYSKERWHI